MSYSIPTDTRHILSVTKLNRLARTVLQAEIGLVWLSAEVSNFVAAGSGHWYFTLKDNKAQIRAAMFKQANRYIQQRPKEGDRIIVRASVSLYEPRGDYQLIVEHLEAEGEGKLKLAYEQLKKRLHGQGLFDASRKRPLPDKIETIGVITSASGAALHDVLSVLARRSPDCKVIVYPSLVQGEQASNHLRKALRVANQRNEVDVLLLTRGGGSIEDLWCFNDEALANDIAQSKLVIVSAVGHEIDTTISDYVADLRAPTPSAAAELLSTDINTRLHQIDGYKQRLHSAIDSVLRHAGQRTHNLSRQLSLLHPSRQLQQHAQRLDMISMRLTRTINASLQRHDERFNAITKRLRAINLIKEAIQGRLRQDQASLRLAKAWKEMVKTKTHSLQAAASKLHAISPLATLARGYTITRQNEQVISRVDQLDIEQPMVTKLADGEIVSIPQSIRKI